MTDAPSEPAGDTKPHVWFPDTGALVTLAVHPPLQRAVVATLPAHDRVLVEAVVAELEGLTATSHAAAAWAGMALSQLDWLGARPVSCRQRFRTTKPQLCLSRACERCTRSDVPADCTA